MRITALLLALGASTALAAPTKASHPRTKETGTTDSSSPDFISPGDPLFIPLPPKARGLEARKDQPTRTHETATDSASASPVSPGDPLFIPLPPKARGLEARKDQPTRTYETATDSPSASPVSPGDPLFIPLPPKARGLEARKDHPTIDCAWCHDRQGFRPGYKKMCTGHEYMKQCEGHKTGEVPDYPPLDHDWQDDVPYVAPYKNAPPNAGKDDPKMLMVRRGEEAVEVVNEADVEAAAEAAMTTVEHRHTRTTTVTSFITRPTPTPTMMHCPPGHWKCHPAGPNDPDDDDN